MKREIVTESFVRKMDGAAAVGELRKGEREAFSRWLRETFLSELYRGEAQVAWAEPADKGRKAPGGP